MGTLLKRAARKTHVLGMVLIAMLLVSGSAYADTVGFQVESALSDLGGSAVRITDTTATPTGGTNNAVRIPDDTGSITRSLSNADLDNGVQVWARSGQVGGSASVRVLVDGAIIGTKPITSGSFASYFFAKSIAPGTHSIRIRAVNAATGHVLTVDRAYVLNKSLDTSIDSGTAEGSVSTSQDASFGFSSSESGASFECQMDNGGYSACSSPKSYSALSYGSHTFSVRARSVDGYLDPTPATRSFTVTEPLALGTATVAGYPNYPLDPQPLDDFVSMTGKTPAVVNWFQDWSGGFVREHFEDVSRRGAMPMVTWSPNNYPRSGNAVNQPDYALRTIIAGDHDAYIRNYARESAAWGKPMYMRFAHEMNGDWYPWAAGVNGNTSAEYVAAWRHVHDIFQQEGATNVRWVWAPNYAFSGTTPFAELYPGDAYVDWVGIDGYNWGGTQWTSFADIFGPSYRTLAQMTNKPMMIAETSSAEAGGDKAAWIRQALLKDVPYNFPRLKAVLWFNIDLERDWRVNSSEASLAAYKEVVASPLYQGKIN